MATVRKYLHTDISSFSSLYSLKIVKIAVKLSRSLLFDKSK